MVPETAVKTATAITGCARRCPCRLWINCDYYTEEKKRRERLRNKTYSAGDWYREKFREEVTMPDFSTSG